MSFSKIWLHTGQPCNGCAGIGEMWARLHAAGVPFAVYSVENGGLIAEASQYPGATLVYRTLATDVAPYSLTPQAAAAMQWQRELANLPPEVKALKGRVWVELGNEQDKGRADWLGHYYSELAALALADGYRLAGPAWSTGEPEPEHWNTPGWLRYLRLCAQHPERLAVSVHEYSLNADDIMDGSPWLVGRVRFLFDTCNANGIHPPAVFVTEAGWTHNDLPYADKARADIDALARLYATYPTVKAAFLWSAMGGGDKAALAAELNALIPWLTDYAITTRFPDVDIPAPPPAATNLLVNGSFEDGWTDATTFPGQHPTGWEVVWNAGDEYHNPHSIWHYQVGEGVHKSAAFLPPEERDVFIWDGEWTYKLFADKKSFWARLKQTIDLPAGNYRLSTPVWVDCYRWVGFKDYAVEPWQAEIKVNANNGTARDWTLLVSGGKRAMVTDITHDGGPLKLGIHLRCNWPISNNLWLDGWELTAVTEEPPAPPPPPPVTEKPVLILDVSKHQENIYPAKMKAAGVDAVILRASYGGMLGSKTDEKVHDFAPKLQAAGMPISFYHFLHSKQPVDVQFNLFRAVVEKYGFSFPLALDLEEHVGGDDSLMAAKAAEFLALMDKHFPLPAGRRHMIYTSEGYYPKIGSPAWGGRYDLWLAQWNTFSRPSIPPPWNTWRLWQHTNTGDGPAYGVGSARVDLNRFNGTRADFAAWLVDGQPAPDFDAAMMALGQSSRLITRHPEFALEAAMIRDGYAPLGDEKRGRLDAAGPVYAYQLAGSLDGKRERTYFAFDGDWGGVDWTNGTSGPPVVTVPDGAIDMLPYVRGDGTLYEVKHPDGSQERFQTQTDGDYFYLVKNSQWEELYADDGYIWRGRDTSPGGGRYYIQYEPLMKRARWMPRYMRPGQTWIGPGHMVQFYDKATCKQSAANSGNATNRMTFKARHAVKEWNGVKVQDVVELTNGSETYFYAKNLGLVGWKSAWGESYISEIHPPGSRPDNVRETGCFS